MGNPTEWGQGFQTKQALVGSDFHFEDDFVGSAINTGLWLTTTGATTAADTNASGVAVLTASAAVNLSARPLTGTYGDFRLAAAFRLPTWTGNDNFWIGWTDTVLGHVFGFVVTRAGGVNSNILAWNGGQVADSGVALPTGASYARVLLQKQGTTWYWWVNGTVFFSSTTPPLSTPIIAIQNSTSGSGNVMNVDYVRCWFQRGSSQGAQSIWAPE